MLPNASVLNLDTPLKGFRTYKIKGVDQIIVARKGGPKSEEVKLKESYAEVRNHQKEFGAASMIAKNIRKALTGHLAEICETYVSGRLSGKIRNLAKKEEGKIGTRPILCSKHGSELKDFQFNPAAPFQQVFQPHYFIKQGSRRGQVIMHFPSYTPKAVIQAPDFVTNFKISARLVALSDLKFDDTVGKYILQEEELNGTIGKYESAMLPMLRIPLEPMTAQLSLPHLKENCQEVGYFLILAICFYKYEKGIFHHVPKASSMTIAMSF